MTRPRILAILAVNRPLLPRWLGLFGLVVTAGAILGAFAPIHGEEVGAFEVIGHLLWPLWILIAGPDRRVDLRRIQLPG